MGNESKPRKGVFTMGMVLLVLGTNTGSIFIAKNLAVSEVRSKMGGSLVDIKARSITLKRGVTAGDVHTESLTSGTSTLGKAWSESLNVTKPNCGTFSVIPTPSGGVFVLLLGKGIVSPHPMIQISADGTDASIVFQGNSPSVSLIAPDKMKMIGPP